MKGVDNMQTNQQQIPFENDAPDIQTIHTVFESISHRLSPTNMEENKYIRMKRLLGNASQGLSDAQIEALTINFQFLIDTWLDEYERKIFNGKLLKEVLNEEV